MDDIILRPAEAADRAFIMKMSPVLAGVAKLPWLDKGTVQAFQDRYIETVLADQSGGATTLIAEKGGDALGFIHFCRSEDEISREACGYVHLLAVTPEAQGLGIGRKLVAEAEAWSKAQGLRLLKLDVFANNANGRGFYEELGFSPETIVMTKPLS